MEKNSCKILNHRVSAKDVLSVQAGKVMYSPIKSIWFLGMLSAAVIGGFLYV